MNKKQISNVRIANARRMGKTSRAPRHKLLAILINRILHRKR